MTASTCQFYWSVQIWTWLIPCWCQV
jgi:hypothetical protein